jgi:hypothetical protein
MPKYHHIPTVTWKVVKRVENDQVGVSSIRQCPCVGVLPIISRERPDILQQATLCELTSGQYMPGVYAAR